MPTVEKSTTSDFQSIFEHYEIERDSLIPILQEVQVKDRYISQEAVAAISEYLDISETEIYGVATFYAQFRFSRPGDHIVRVCQGTACHVRGGKRIMDEVCKQLGIGPGETTPDYKFSIDRVACFGSCALAPVMVIDDTVYGRMTPQRAKQILKEIG